MKPRTMLLLLTLALCLGCTKEGGPDDCTHRGGSCSDSYECCGADVCDAWQCVAPALACAATGDFCLSNGDCCNFEQGVGWCVDSVCKDSCSSGVECVSGCCAPTSISGVSTCADASYCASCLPVRSYCSADVQCCGAMLCDPGMGTCCSQLGMGCVYDNDCCGVLLCYAGTCG